MEKRPNVFPTNTQQSQQNLGNNTENKVSVDSDYEEKRLEMANQVYQGSMNETGMAAVEAMRKRTEEQIRQRDEMLKRNQEQTQSYQNQFDDAKNREKAQPQPQPQQPLNYQQINQQKMEPQQNTFPYKNEPQLTNTNATFKSSYVDQLSQPQFNASFDVIPLPSEGKLYKNKKSSIKVAHMTTADENILTSPNLLQSGEFLEILINRKILDNDIRYRDLHVGDRNAIMLWLRATSYGEMYKATFFDDTDDTQFEAEINLNDLKTKKLNVDPDEEGYFEFVLPLSKKHLKFKLLTCGDLDDIERLTEKDKEENSPVNNVGTYILERQIVEVDGVRDKNFIREFIQTIRIKDVKELRDYINSIDCGVDLEIEVPTPRGGSIKTFLPLNIGFFWPDFSV